MIRIFSICIICMMVLCSRAEDLDLASGDISKAKFSPDGKYVSWVEKDGRKYSLYVISSDGRGNPRLLFSGLYRRTFYSWSPDGKSIACSGKEGRKKILTMISVDSGKTRALGEGFNPVFLPSGQKLLFFSLTDLCIIDLKIGKIRKLSNFQQRQSFERIAVAGENIYFSNNGDLWHATFKQQAKMLADHKLSGSNALIQNPVVAPGGKTIYVSLITDGLYAHATDNVLGQYKLKDGSMTRLSEANSWTMRPDGKILIYSLGGELKTWPGKEVICKGGEPVFSPDGTKLLYLISSGWEVPHKLKLRTVVEK